MHERVNRQAPSPSPSPSGNGEGPPILATTRFVVENARLVTIDRDRIAAVAADLAGRRLQPTTYDCERHLCGIDPAVANFVLVLDTLNFSFWADPGESRWRVTAGGEAANGYWALVAALRRALAEGIPLADAHFLAAITKEELAHVLRGEGSIPLLDERVAAVREIGRGLLERDGGQFAHMVERANRSAPILAGLLASEFSSFADVASFAGRPVYFHKRAQICCSDLYGASGGRAWGALTGLDRLTAFADYKVPQVLRHLGILVYAADLAEWIDSRIHIQAGSEGEVEIRAATIWGVEYLRAALADRNIHLRAFELDWHLWELGQTLPTDTPPYHLTRTIFY